MADYLTRQGKHDLAYTHTEAPDENTLTVVFCPGYRSDMQGTKATYLENICQNAGLGYLRFDYSGHGLSGGEFETGTIGQWLEDTLDIIDELIAGQCLIVGSSMGGWIGLLTALERQDKVKGFIGIAAAPDFTRGIKANLRQDQKDQLEAKGYFEVPTPYSEYPQRFGQNLLEEGEKHCILDKSHSLDIPLTLCQGMEDPDVDWQTAIRISRAVGNDNARVLLLEDGDHRLSREQDLALLKNEVLNMAGVNKDKSSKDTGYPEFVACKVALSNS